MRGEGEGGVGRQVGRKGLDIGDSERKENKSDEKEEEKRGE